MAQTTAFRLHRQAALPEADLRLDATPIEAPGPGQLLLEVEACGVCRTDLHIVEGDVPAHRLPVTLGHQVVARVAAAGSGTEVEVGTRVGVGWLAWSCGDCPACRSGRENLCPEARFTGYDVDGGYAGLMLAEAAFAYPLPPTLADPVAAAPLLCGGVIGYRALRLAGVLDGPPGRLLLVGFGNSASIALQVARTLGWQCYVTSRSEVHRSVAAELGAVWTGTEPEAESVEAAVIFAPAGPLVPAALAAVRPGGTVACAGITMTDIPGFPYALLYGERTLRSVANATRRDALELLGLAGRVAIRTETEAFELTETASALGRVAASTIRASGVVDLHPKRPV